ncbi:MAG: hypothetical protein H6731_08865 [Myxococcales bacterium]|nr:MAG: hypothetical protein H6731_08865 [Myxococcales bacterium]
MVQCDKSKCCCQRAALLISGIIFTFVAVCHLWRVFSGQVIMLGDNAIPNWVSIVGIVVASIMAILNFCALKCPKCKAANPNCSSS